MNTRWFQAVLWLLLAWSARAQEAVTVRPLEEIYPGVAALRATVGDVVCLVDTEHPDTRRKELRERAPVHHSLERIRLGIELEAAGLPCLLTHASLLTLADLARPQVKAVVICGRGRRTSAEEDRRLFTLIRECPAPMLCLGGAQGLLASAHGGKTGVMRELRPGEVDPDPSSMPGFFKETGFTEVRVVAPDPVFDGMGDTVTVFQSHSAEVKELPPQFALLASTAECRVQACRHTEKPLYGMQFLPDRFNELHPDGRRILQNFFEVAGIDTELRLPEAQAAFRAKIRPLVGKICQEPTALRQQAAPFVALVNMEGPAGVASERRGSGSGMTHGEKIEQFRRRIETELAWLPCVVVHHAEVSRDDFANPHLRAIVLTGAASPCVRPLCRELYAVIREARVPVLGVCAGHHHVAEAHGTGISLMRPLRDGERDPHPAYHPGRFKEWGFLPVEIVRRDPLFDGLPDAFVVQEYHVGSVNAVPEGFDLLARTAECEIQTFKRRDKPVYGTQFHPECYDDAHTDGKRLLQNFFRIAAERGGHEAR